MLDKLARVAKRSEIVIPPGGFVVTTVTATPASRKAQAQERRIPEAAETSGEKIRLTITARVPTRASRRSMESGRVTPGPVEFTAARAGA